MVRRSVCAFLGAALLTLFGSAAIAATPLKIVTGSERGTYIQIGRDLARFVAPGADIDLEVLPSAGSAENVHRLRYEPGVKFALVQSDVYQAFINQGEQGIAQAATLIRPLRVVLPLYNEEIYFIVRADSPMQWVHDIKGARISAGPMRSGTAMSTATIYNLLFRQAIPEATTSFQSNEDGLAKLVGDKSVDVVVVVAGQPAKVLADMKAEARDLIRLLKFDPAHASSREVTRTYFQSTVRAANYPNLLTQDVPGLAVKAFLVTYDYNLQQTVASLTRFGRSLCAQFETLRTSGHPKWREVELATPELGKGWQYYAPIAREIGRCTASAKAEVSAPAPAATVQPRSCTIEQNILGLCR